MSNIVRNQSPKGAVLAHVSANLRRLRRQAGLSQEGVAGQAGLSRRMIVKLEAGDTNISLANLDRLAEALGVRLVDLISDPATGAKAAATLAWRGADAESAAVLLGSVPATREVQFWSWSLGAGEHYRAEPDPPGWQEMVTVSEGRLRIDLAAGPLLVEAGGFALFDGAQPYAFVNAGEGVVRFVCTGIA